MDFKALRLICRKCGRELPWDLPGAWEASAPAQDEIHSYAISKLDSPFLDLARCLEASQSDSPVAVEEFHNSDLGEPYQEPGTGLTIADLDACRGKGLLWERTAMMGVDVGRRFHHVVIREFDKRGAGSRPLLITKIRSLDEVRPLMDQFDVRWCVVDAQPEFQKVQEIKRGRHRRIYSAFYDRERGRHTLDQREREMHLNRTQLLDELYAAFREGRQHLPADARTLGGNVRDGIGDYYRQMLAHQRVVERNSSGDWVAHFDSANRPDHYAHAEAYCLAAYIVRGQAPRPGVA